MNEHRWKPVDCGDGDIYYECGMCGFALCLIEGDPEENQYIYCPRCGQKLDGLKDRNYGEWLPVDDQDDAFDCPFCDAMVQKRVNFCPKCGADMRGRCKESDKRQDQVPDMHS